MKQQQRFAMIFFAIFCLALQATRCYSSDSLSHRSSHVLLVQLNSQENRISSLVKDKRYSDAEEVRQDAAAVASLMKKDFRDHFHYCPVYYYVDTNVEHIKNHEFDGILMKADGTVLARAPMAGKEYLIACYGYPAAPAGRIPAKDSSEYIYNSGDRASKGLVVYNSRFQQVTYYYRYGYLEALFPKKSNKAYIYHSRHFEIDYFPLADKLDKRLREGKK